jgi:hypothetical protein
VRTFFAQEPPATVSSRVSTRDADDAAPAGQGTVEGRDLWEFAAAHDQLVASPVAAMRVDVGAGDWSALAQAVVLSTARPPVCQARRLLALDPSVRPWRRTTLTDVSGGGRGRHPL